MQERAFSALARAVLAANVTRDRSFANRAQFWIEHFGDRDITAITTDDVDDGIDALIKRGKFRAITCRKPDGVVSSTVVPTGQPLGSATVNRYIASLGTIFKELRRMRLLPRGFVSPMRGVARQPEGAGRTVSVTVDDVKRLIDACRVSRNRKLAALTAMACTTGWRLGSLQSLRWADLDLDRGHADTLRTKNGTPHRTPLLPWVVDELRRMRPSLARPADPVFDKKNFRKAWETALRLADLPTEWTFHHCRHIAASVLAQSGASVVTIMQALNHKTPLMAMRYSHLNTAALRDSLGRAWQ
jgi:integrase